MSFKPDQRVWYDWASDWMFGFGFSYDPEDPIYKPVPARIRDEEDQGWFVVNVDPRVPYHPRMVRNCATRVEHLVPATDEEFEQYFIALELTN